MFWLAPSAHAQTTANDQGANQGIGLRFAANFNRFFRAEDYPLVDGRFSNAEYGLTYKFYGRAGHAEFGLAYGHKNQRGGFNFPLVMQDFSDDQNTGFQYVQLDLRAGPRVWWHIYPKFGILLNYRISQAGFLEDTPAASGIDLNRFDARIPIGISVDLPTSFGTTGIGFFYEVGLASVIGGRNVNDGSRINALNFEIHVLLRTR